jgi:hypothetical protein
VDKQKAALLNPRAIAGGAVAASACAAANALVLRVQGPMGLLNDFYIYWSTARVLNQGGNAYSLKAVAAAHDAAGLPGLMGAGYSYPPIFVELLRPLALLPARSAGAIFAGLSLLALGIATALLLASIPRLSWPQASLLGALVGVFPPVAGGLWVGQANLLLLPAFALAYRGVAPGLWLMVATSVKLYPAAGFAAFAGRDRMRQLGLASLTGLALLVVPMVVGAGGGGFRQMLAGNLTPDTYFTNQSVMGFLSRMAKWRGWPIDEVSVTYVDTVLVLVLAIVTTAVLWRCRFQCWEGSLALSICLGAVIAPRNSLWNLAPLLLCFAHAVPRSRGRPWLAAWLMTGFALTVVQPVVWSVSLSGGSIAASAYADPLVAWTSSFGLYGGLIAGAVCGRLLLRPGAEPGTARVPAGARRQAFAITPQA